MVGWVSETVCTTHWACRAPSNVAINNGPYHSEIKLHVCKNPDGRRTESPGYFWLFSSTVEVPNATTYTHTWRYGIILLLNIFRINRRHTCASRFWSYISCDFHRDVNLNSFNSTCCGCNKHILDVHLGCLVGFRL